MKSDSLLKLTIVSDVRKNLLYQLIDGPMSLSEIRDHFDVTSANVIPRIKDLVKMELVMKEGGDYHLTSTGLIIAKKLKMMDRLEEIIEKNGKFLNGHDLIPLGKLIDDIDELGDFEIISNVMENITATHDQTYNNLSKAKYIVGISPVLTQSYPETYLAIAQQGIPVSLIVTRNVYKRIESEYSLFLTSYLGCDNAKMYVIDDVKFALVVTNDFLSLYLYGKNGTLDIMNCLQSFDESAVNWGTELFQEYLLRAKEIVRQ